jgi:hypothetical protein
MTSKPNLPNSKHLDHILPRNQGGTHTLGNGRIICASCNMRRPKDGSDFAGQLTLWAQGPVSPSPASGQGNRNADTCRKGLHPWTPANINVGPDGHKRCAPCLKARDRKYPLRQCECGTLFAAPGKTFMCTDCVEVTARRAAGLHASGLTWEQVATEVGYESGTGAWYAAKRIGYVPAPPVKADTRRLCPDCGTPKRDRARRCDPCMTEKAWQAAGMYQDGMTLGEIGDRIGFSSRTGVSNLIRSVADVEMHVGRPSRLRSMTHA